jgi:GT2 family glycosyltransferase
MKDYMDIEASVASCCGNLFGADMAPVTSFHRLFPSIKGELNNLLLFLPERIRYGRNRFFNFTKRPLSVAAGTGADLMIRKAVVDKIGLFDDRFFMYYEDVELCHRIRAHGYDIVNVPGAQIQHLEGRSSSNMQLKADFVFKGRETFYLAVEKGKRYRRICNMIFSLYCCLRCFFGVFQGKASRQFWLRMVHNCIMSKYIL